MDKIIGELTHHLSKIDDIVTNTVENNLTDEMKKKIDGNIWLSIEEQEIVLGILSNSIEDKYLIISWDSIGETVRVIALTSERKYVERQCSSNKHGFFLDNEDDDNYLSIYDCWLYNIKKDKSKIRSIKFTDPKTEDILKYLGFSDSKSNIEALEKVMTDSIEIIFEIFADGLD